MRLLGLAFAFLPLTACADTIDDFVFTDGAHTVTFSLPSTFRYHDCNVCNTYAATGTGTVDGVAQNVTSVYNVFNLNSATDALYVSFGTSYPYLLYGPSLITYVSVASPNPPPYLPYDIVGSFTTGTYSQIGFDTKLETFTVSITPEVAATPEPSSLMLLGTGAVALAGSLRSRRRLSSVARR